MGQDAATPGFRARIITGTYTGNGADDRNIDIGIDLASKQYPYVIVKGDSTNFAKHRTEYAQGDQSMAYNNIADFANTIQSFTSTGFQVGSHAEVNFNANVYRYIAFWSEL